MNQPTLSKSFEEYLDVVRAQCKKHGRKALIARSDSNPKEWRHYLGFESPDGWFAIELRDLKKSFVTNEWHESEITLPSGAKIKKCSRILPNDKIIAEVKRLTEKALSDEGL